MSAETITLQIPETLLRRLENTARAMGQTLDDVILRSLQVGSPPQWDDAPPEYQADLASLDRLDDTALWLLARGHKTETEMARYDDLLERKQSDRLTEAESLELQSLRADAERFMLRKAQAVVLLRWRGHQVPLP